MPPGLPHRRLPRTSWDAREPQARAGFNRALEVALITPRYHPFHDLRHTFATELLLAGVPIFRVSKWLGHASIQTTCDSYGHLLPSPDDLEVMEALDQRLNARGTIWAQGRASQELERRGARVANMPQLLLSFPRQG